MPEEKKDENIPNYLPALTSLPDEFCQLGTVSIATVAHDDWCAFFKGKPCNCEPIITVKKVEPKRKENKKHGRTKRIKRNKRR